MAWISPAAKPRDRTASYYNLLIKVKMKGGEFIRRVRGVYSGEITDYTGPCTATTADMPTFKLHLYATVSEDASFMTADIHDFYLGSDLKTLEYMWLTKPGLSSYVGYLWGCYCLGA